MSEPSKNKLTSRKVLAETAPDETSADEEFPSTVALANKWVALADIALQQGIGRKQA